MDRHRLLMANAIFTQGNGFTVVIDIETYMNQYWDRVTSFAYSVNGEPTWHEMYLPTMNNILDNVISLKFRFQISSSYPSDAIIYMGDYYYCSGTAQITAEFMPNNNTSLDVEYYED